MSNIYHDYLEQLRNINIGQTPAMTMYVPLRWTDTRPDKIFLALVKAADNLLIKDGYKKLDLMMPDWDRWTKQGTITLAIFHHSGVTTLIPIPTRMQPRVVVAKSFHVKPIIIASQEYVDGLVLHFNESSASLYRVNPVGEILINSYLPTEIVPKKDWPSRIDKSSLRDFLNFLSLEIKGAKLSTTKFLGITGGDYPELRSQSFWRTTKLPITFLDDSFKLQVPNNAFSIIRLRLSQLVNERYIQAVGEVLKEGHSSQEGLSVRSLGTKILNQQINHLCVSLDDMHFGEIDPTTGEAILNRTQKDASDDDLLDDLVELALDNGIKVSVVPKKYLPTGRSFIAS